MRIWATLVVIALVTAGCATTKHQGLDIEQLIELHNAERAKNNLGDLQIDRNLAYDAQRHAEKMARTGSLKHQDLQVYFRSWHTAGENIAEGQSSAVEVTRDWMRSPGHRRNILGHFTHVGFGVAFDKNGRTFWCAIFAG
jgi:uncharacterized protein YkwD